eukprot:2355647-Lingulodinium_polyedra.AAC.1
MIGPPHGSCLAADPCQEFCDHVHRVALVARPLDVRRQLGLRGLDDVLPRPLVRSGHRPQPGQGQHVRGDLPDHLGGLTHVDEDVWPEGSPRLQGRALWVRRGLAALLLQSLQHGGFQGQLLAPELLCRLDVQLPPRFTSMRLLRLQQLHEHLAADQ